MTNLTRRQMLKGSLVVTAAGLLVLSGCGSSAASSASGSSGDPTCQRAAQAALKSAAGKAGAIVMVDPATGEVLALESKGDPISASAEKSVALELHAPGSVFKMITLMAALESQAITPDKRFNGPAELSLMGGSVSNAGLASYQGLTASEAFAQSVNTIFAQIALRVSAPVLKDYCQGMGFGQPLAGSGHPSSVMQGDSFSQLQLAWMGAGQPLYQNNNPDQFVGPKVSALHLALIAAAVANGGVLYEPFGCGVDAGHGASALNPVKINQAIASASTISYVQEAMAQVVSEGTGTQAAVQGVDVRGKTGTAESGRGYNDCWFVGYAEKEGKQVALAVLLEAESSTEACKAANACLSSLFG